MLRSLSSAVSDMQAHQTKLDVIGNNTANVNIYGFKSSQICFQDVYYQTPQSATGGDNNKGSTNASQAGYGIQLAGVDLNMGRSALQSTDRPMDVVTTGEGFFQVMGSDGNILYTRAGNLRLDNNSGNLVDANGYMVLGVTDDPLGEAAGADKTCLNIPGESNAQFANSQTINGIGYTITSQNITSVANVIIPFRLDDTLPDGADIVVKSGELKDSSITVSVNKNTIFTSLSDFSSKMNVVITRANNGEVHLAEDFTITAVPVDKILKTSLTGGESLGEDFGTKAGVQRFMDTADIKDDIFRGLKPSSTSTGPEFTASGKVSYEMMLQATTNTEPAAWIIRVTVESDNESKRYFIGKVSENSTSASSVWLKEDGTTPLNDQPGQHIEPEYPGYAVINGACRDLATGSLTKTNVGTIAAAANPNDLELRSKSFTLTNGSEGGDVVLSGVGVTILSNGIVEATHPDLGKIQVGCVDLVTFDNPYNLEGVGNSYFETTANSGNPKLCQVGENNTGVLRISSLEISSADISTESTDMIVIWRGLQANSRIITVSDSILEKPVNLERQGNGRMVSWLSLRS